MAIDQLRDDKTRVVEVQAEHQQWYETEMKKMIEGRLKARIEEQREKSVSGKMQRRLVEESKTSKKSRRKRKKERSMLSTIMRAVVFQLVKKIITDQINQADMGRLKGLKLGKKQAEEVA